MVECVGKGCQSNRTEVAAEARGGEGHRQSNSLNTHRIMIDQTQHTSRVGVRYECEMGGCVKSPMANSLESGLWSAKKSAPKRETQNRNKGKGRMGGKAKG